MPARKLSEAQSARLDALLRKKKLTRWERGEIRALADSSGLVDPRRGQVRIKLAPGMGTTTWRDRNKPATMQDLKDILDSLAGEE